MFAGDLAALPQIAMNTSANLREAGHDLSAPTARRSLLKVISCAGRPDISNIAAL